MILKNPWGLHVREAGIIYFKHRSKILHTFTLGQLTLGSETWHQRMTVLKGCSGGKHDLLWTQQGGQRPQLVKMNQDSKNRTELELQNLDLVLDFKLC